MPEFTQEEVSKHNSPESLWIIIDNKVYDLTEFQKIHPGGKAILKRWAGKDASKFFHKYHEKEKVMKQYGNERCIGDLKLEANSASALVKNDSLATERHEHYGDMLPFSDPEWYQGYPTPYFNDTHAALRQEIRSWVEENLSPYVDEWDEKEEMPKDLYRKFAQAGFLSAIAGHYGKDYTNLSPKSVPVDKIDQFHELIITDELSRCGSGGVVWNLCGGFSIGLPPVLKFARPELKKRVVPQILAGDKRICLCITEPDVGSDVANLTTTAEKTADGKHYIVNGMKKWITNGVWADYFTVAVRTGGKGMGGISMILIEKTMPGVTVNKIHTQGMRVSGSTLISFEDVKVPVENILGGENKGFKVIMSNFNQERLGVIMQVSRFCRVCIEESIKHAHRRETFGVKLIEHPVIRQKIATMAARTEAGHHWLESLLYQFGELDELEGALRLGGPIAACKAFFTQTLEYCAREACQIFGGLAYTRGGRGGKVERIYREVRAYAIPGGSEEIMLDLAIRQALKVNQGLGAKL